MAVCIAIISKENYPLYMKTVESLSTGSQDLKYWYTVHTSLDVIEEKTRRQENKDLYLGLLYLIEDYRIYGFITNTKIKFLIIIETSNQQYHDTEIKIMFKKIHSCYINAVCNPFYEIGTSIKSKKLEDLLKTLMLKQATPSSSLTNSPSALNNISPHATKQTEII